MKRSFLFLFVSLGLSLGVFSQATYHKLLDQDTTTWQHFAMVQGVRPVNSNTFTVYLNNSSYAAIDSISINSLKYRKLYYLNTPATINYTSKTLIGYLREDTINKRVFFLENTTASETLLYDFGLNLNDSIFLTFPFSSSNGYYRVDSIVTKNELSGSRKHFYLRKHLNNYSPNFDYFEFIEGIGSTLHLLYRFNQGIMSNFFATSQPCYHPWSVGLACKYNDNVHQYQSCTSAWSFWFNTSDPCNYFYTSGGLNKNELVSNFEVYPNPSNSKLNISLNASRSIKLAFEITDLSGRVIKTIDPNQFNSGENNTIIDISGLKDGLYILKTSCENSNSTRLFTVLH